MGKRVLVVDDAAFMRLQLTRILSDMGHEVIGEAKNGSEAIVQYRQLQPDVVLMDVTMPEMDGLAAVKAIKGDDPNAVIIMVSAMGQKAIVLEAIQSGARDFIVKPFKEERIQKVMDSL